MPYVQSFGSRKYILVAHIQLSLAGVPLLKGAELYTVQGAYKGYLAVWNMSPEVKRGLLQYAQAHEPEVAMSSYPDPRHRTDVRNDE